MTVREFDVLLLGATGITGRLALEYLTRRCSELGRSFAVGARRAQRVRELCADAGIEAPPIFDVDASDADPLAEFAQRGAVLINLVGPYTKTGEGVVRACVEAGTSYLDLTAETQFVRRVDAAWHERARSAGVAVVQTSGLEALPADLAVEVARETLRARGERLATADVQLQVRHSGGGGAVSGGTVRSILEIFADPDAPRLADVAFRIPDAADAELVRSASPPRLWPRISAGWAVAPMIPVAFINPPVLHRTAWLLAREAREAGEAGEAGEPFVPLRFRDGARLAPARGPGGVVALLAAGLLGAGQAVVVAASTLPPGARRVLADILGRIPPQSGTGPQGPTLEEWRWDLLLTAGSDRKKPVRVRIEAEGHPGYLTTARMISELALIIADGSGSGRVGCITPALAAGAASAPRFAAAGMRFSTGS